MSHWLNYRSLIITRGNTLPRPQRLCWVELAEMNNSVASAWLSSKWRECFGHKYIWSILAGHGHYLLYVLCKIILKCVPMGVELKMQSSYQCNIILNKMCLAGGYIISLTVTDSHSTNRSHLTAHEVYMDWSISSSTQLLTGGYLVVLCNHIVVC